MSELPPPSVSTAPAATPPAAAGVAGSPAAIELSRLTRRFGHTTAVNDLTLSIPAGTTCGFVGLNGAGKTTTLRMLVGLLAPTSGSITVAGFSMPAHRQIAKLHIGYVPDRPNIYGWMRVREAIDFCRQLYGPQWSAPHVAQLANLLRLDPDRRVKHLSKGGAAKLQLLLAVGHDPEVLILDEPTIGFDPLARDEFLEGLLNLQPPDKAAAPDPTGSPSQQRRTILFSSHTLSDVQRLADSVAMMHEGRLLFHRPLDQLLERTKRIRAVLEDLPSTDAPLAMPEGAFRQQRRGREWIVSADDFSPQQVQFIQATHRVRQLDVIDLTLDDIFRDHVRAITDTSDSYR